MQSYNKSLAASIFFAVCLAGCGKSLKPESIQETKNDYLVCRSEIDAYNAADSYENGERTMMKKMVGDGGCITYPVGTKVKLLQVKEGETHTRVAFQLIGTSLGDRAPTPGQSHEILFTDNGLRMGVVNCCEDAFTLGFAKSRKWTTNTSR